MAIINVLLGYRAFADIGQIKAFIKDNCVVNSDENVENAEAIVLFETSRQRTWLIVTEQRMFCVLDDVEEESSVIKWNISKEDLVANDQFILNLKVNSTYKPKTGLVDFGSDHKAWLYSKKLYPTGSDLKNKIQQMIEDKMIVADKCSAIQY